MFILAYGSLLLPASLRSTLPSVSVTQCRPAAVHGYRRDFGVAFPNNGSQPDKAYVHTDGGYPSVVRFANVYSAPGAVLTGVCVPVDDDALDRLRARELRYELIDVTDAVRVETSSGGGGGAGVGDGVGRVLMFTGTPTFTAAADVARGVVQSSYLEAIRQGADFWATRSPGFETRVEASTDWPAPADVVPLRRIRRPSARTARDPGLDAMVGPWRS